MDKSKLWILEGAAIGIAVILAGIFFFKNGNQLYTPQKNSTKSLIEQSSKTDSGIIIQSSEIPKDIELTNPEDSVPAATGSNIELGLYELVMSKNGFTPNSIVVPIGDVVRIFVSAADDNYDFSMPFRDLYLNLKKGDRKEILFRARDFGTFGFGCVNNCPSTGSITGQLIVLPE